ncbi:MAG: recombinase XerD, partial [Alphaproteobacteria bacterium]|nr:recombinase XerD [Alphaproteobacteria bacterium]
MADEPTASAIDAFLEMLAAERGSARLTIEAYRRDLLDFAAFAVRKGVPADGADTRLIRDYLAGLGRVGLEPSTVARRLSCIRQFHRFLFSEGLRTDDPCFAVEGPKR